MAVLEVVALAIDPVEPTILECSGRRWLLEEHRSRHELGGKANVGLAGRDALVLTVDPGDAKRVYAGTEGGGVCQ